MPIVLRFLRAYLSRHVPWYVAGVAALAGTSWLSVTIPMKLAAGIDVLEAALIRGSGQDPASDVDHAALLAHVFSEGATLDPVAQAQIASIAGTVALMALALVVIRTLSRVAFFTPGRLVEAEVKRDLFAAILAQQPSMLRAYPTGDLVSRCNSDVTNLRLFAGFAVMQLVNVVLIVTMAGGRMLEISPTLAALALLPIVVAMGIVQLAIRQLFGLMRQMQRETADLGDHVLSSYQGIAAIQSFNAEQAFLDRFRELRDRYLWTSLRRAQIRAFIGPVLSVAAAVNVFFVLWVGGPMAARGEVTTGELVAFMALSTFVVGPLRGLSFILNMLKGAQASLERIDAIVDPPPDRPEGPRGLPAPAEPPAIAVRDLRFAYPDAPDALVLDGIDLELKPGETLGVLGPTGSGKSTLLRVLARLYNPPEASVFVDGEDVRRLDLDDWRRRMTLVPQRAWLFSEALGDNVLLGQPDDGRLERVLELVALDADVAALPAGKHTLVGETGVRLSGGQRQRAALARGLLRDHVVLLLDDVMSAVDHETEHRLIAALQSSPRQPTTVIVSNRISAFQGADRVAILVDGRLQDLGTHEELVARPGFYRDTWERQQAEEVEA